MTARALSATRTTAARGTVLAIVILESPEAHWGIRGKRGGELQLSDKVET